MSIYGYANQNSITQTDPLGLFGGDIVLSGNLLFLLGFPTEQMHLTRNRYNKCPCKESDLDSSWQQDNSIYGNKYRSSLGYECGYGADGNLLPDSTYENKGPTIFPDIEQNYSFNFAVNPLSFYHILQDVLPSYIYQNYQTGLTNSGQSCDKCEDN